MESPFLYDNIAKENKFFGRKRELEKLKDITKYSNNILIFSKRRMGKTTLVENFFLQNSSKFLNIYIDIFDITSKEDFAHSLLKALSNSTKKDLKSAITTFTNLFKRVRVEPTIDPNTLEYSLKPIVSTLSFEQMMDDFFNSINTLSKEYKINIAIDEFQQITYIKDIKLDAILRKYIQHRNNISYLFLGSKRHLLSSLFSYNAPLYELATHFELKSLIIEDIYKYAKQYINIQIKNIEYLYQICDGETKLILNILHLIYIQKQKIDNQFINEILQSIISSKDATYRMLYDTLNNNQKIALKIIGKYNNGFFNQDILNQYNIKKQTLNSAINSLFQQELIDKNQNSYFIPDRTFELWVKNTFI